MDAALLMQAAETGGPAGQGAIFWATGMPVTNRGITLLKKWMLGKTVFLHVIINILLCPRQQRP
jgi:hypothetical protein